MRSEMILPFFVVVLGASGTYLLLPHRHGAAKPRTTHLVGAALAGVALLAFAFLWSPPGPWVSGLFFYAFAFATVAGALLTVTSRNPVHSALWFAAVVLATSGLFLQAGASFLAVGTVIVYAGAIIVTFLFVIMLAQMEGRAPYDRAARIPFVATFTCYMLFFGVLWSLSHVRSRPAQSGPGAAAPASAGDSRLPRSSELLGRPAVGPDAGVAEVLARSVRPTARLGENDVLKPHVAGLGETLYTDHLVTVELAGTLLFAALVGALAIATPKPPTRPNNETRTSATVTASTATPTTVNV